MAGSEGPRLPLPLMPCWLGDDPSRDGARGIAGAVCRCGSSQTAWGVPGL